MNWILNEITAANARSVSTKAGVITVIGQITCQVVSLGTTMVLARLLEPSDFGRFAVIAVILGFLKMFTDVGLTFSTIQSKTISQGQVSNLLWLNIGFGLLLTAIAIGLAPIAGYVYSDATLPPAIIFCAVSLTISSFGIQHGALLARNFCFWKQVAAQASGTVAGAAVGLVMALKGYGLTALVAQAITLSVVQTGMLWLTCSWRPTFRWTKNVGTRHSLKFGTDVLKYSIANFGSRNVDRVAIGKIIGLDTLGQYQKACQILILPLNLLNVSMTKVVVPCISRIYGQPEEFKSYYLRLVTLLVILSLPMSAGCLLYADSIFLIVLGAKFSEAAQIFKWLAAIALIQPVFYTIAWIYIGSGRSQELRTWGYIQAGALIFAFLASVGFGVIALAQSYSFVMCVLLFVGLKKVLFGTSVTLIDVFGVWKLPALIAIVAFLPLAGLSSFYTRAYLEKSDTIQIDLICLSLSLILYVVALSIVPSYRVVIVEGIRKVKSWLSNIGQKIKKVA